jgi:hypothetical protein
MAEASAARDFLRDIIVNNATEITEDAIDVTEMEVDSKNRWPKMKRYSATKLFRYINAFCKGIGKWVQHEKDILNMTPLWNLLIGFVIVFLRETLFNKKKAQAVDMNHGLNLGVIEVIRNTEGTKKGAMGLVWLSGTVKDVHRAVEREMKTKVAFKLIGERHDDMWIDGVQLNVKELLIYLIKHFGLEEKARASGFEISITVDGAKLDDYCIHVTCGFIMTDKDARDPLTGKLLLLTTQSRNNAFPITSIIVKDNKSTYNKFLRHIFEFGQELRDDGIPELGWKPFRVSEPQYMKSSQLCMNRGGAAKQIPYFGHLCQKHSDDIAHTNQTVGGKCAQICETGSCYNFPTMDSDVIQKILEKKKRLDQTEEAQCVSFVFEQLYGGDWDAHYAAFYLHVVAFGAKAGVLDVPDEILEPNNYATYLENTVSTPSTLGLAIAPNFF